MNNIIFENNETCPASIQIAPTSVILGLITVVNFNDGNLLHIGQNVIIEHGTTITLDSCSLYIGDNVKIESNTKIIASKSTVRIEKKSKIGFTSKFEINNSILHLKESSFIGDFVKFVLTDGAVNIGDSSKIQDYCLIKSVPGKIDIGSNVKIDENNEITAIGNIYIGENSHFWNGSYISSFKNDFCFHQRNTVGQKSVIAGRGPLNIQYDTMIGGCTYIVTENHICEEPFTPIRDQNFTTKGVKIGFQSWISAHCTILDGVNIGNRTVIGAGAVVTKSIPDYNLAVGVPAKTKKHRIDTYIEYMTKFKDNKTLPNHFFEWIEKISKDDVNDLSERLKSSNSSNLYHLKSLLLNIQRK